MLEVTALRSGYGRVPVLMGTSFRVADGEYLGILGHNGMGKTTLMQTLMGYLPVWSGTLRLDDRTITELSTHQRARLGIGYVPQGRQIYPNLTVLENLQMGCVTRRLPPAAIIDGILTEFPRLKGLLSRRGGALSGGEQQLLALARALCADPSILLLDEPTEGIQPSIVDEIVDTLLRLRARRRLALVIVEQNLDFISALSQRVLTIQKGQISGELQPGDLSDPEIVAEFVGMAA
jgi:urea ABC transporter ATP-binding protein UrtE